MVAVSQGERKEVKGGFLRKVELIGFSEESNRKGGPHYEKHRINIVGLVGEVCLDPVREAHTALWHGWRPVRTHLVSGPHRWARRRGWGFGDKKERKSGEATFAISTGTSFTEQITLRETATLLP